MGLSFSAWSKTSWSFLPSPMPGQLERKKSGLHIQSTSVGEFSIKTLGLSHPQILLVIGLIYFGPWICVSKLVNELKKLCLM